MWAFGGKWGFFPHLSFFGNWNGGCSHRRGGVRKELSAPSLRPWHRKIEGFVFRVERRRESGRRTREADRREREGWQRGERERARPKALKPPLYGPKKKGASFSGPVFGPNFVFWTVFSFLGRFTSCHISMIWVRLFSTHLGRIIFQPLLFNYYH